MDSFYHVHHHNYYHCGIDYFVPLFENCECKSCEEFENGVRDAERLTLNAERGTLSDGVACRFTLRLAFCV